MCEHKFHSYFNSVLNPNVCAVYEIAGILMLVVCCVIQLYYERKWQRRGDRSGGMRVEV